jgi:hypothetical protein
VLARAQALVDHPEHTLDAADIDTVIMQALVRPAMVAEQEPAAPRGGQSPNVPQPPSLCRNRKATIIDVHVARWLNDCSSGLIRQSPLVQLKLLMILTVFDARRIIQ